MFLDLTVVYFAFGAPLGVYEITRHKRSPRTAAVAAVHLVLWPLFAAASLRSSFAADRPEPSLEQQIDLLRGEFETAAYEGPTGKDVLAFRDIFARYTGLAIALRQSNGHISNELFDITGHTDSRAAASCLKRRNRRLLEFHLLQARNEFDYAISRLAMRDPNVRLLACRLGELLNVAE